MDDPGYVHILWGAHEGDNYQVVGFDGDVIVMDKLNEDRASCLWSFAYLIRLVHKATEKVVTIDGDGVTLSEVGASENQIVFIEYLGGGYHKLLFKMGTEQALALGTDSTGALSLASWNDTDAQKWMVVEMEDGFLKLTHSSEKVLDGDGTKVFLSDWDETRAGYQRWSSVVKLQIDRTQPYDTVTTPMAHDSHTDKKTANWPLNESSSPTWEDQTQDVGQQLVGGIRTVRISTGVRAVTTGEIQLVHTIALKPFSGYLELLRDFLDSNPTAVVTIYDEGEADNTVLSKDSFEDDLAGQYADTFGGTAREPGRVFIPGRNGMPSLDTLRQVGWPTLQAMVDAGVQIVVFMANKFPTVRNSDGSLMHPWILSSPDFFSTNPHDNLIRSYNEDVRYAAVDVEASPPLTSSLLFKLNHFFYSYVAEGPEKQSSQKLNIWTVGDLLVENVLRAWDINGRPPHFVNVDFYQGVKGARSHLTSLVRALNASTTLRGLEERVKGCYVQNTNLQIGHPFNNDANQPRYTITNARKGPDGETYALTLTAVTVNSAPPPRSVGTACLMASTQGNLAQSWYLRYNTPSTGIQIITDSEGNAFVLRSADYRDAPGYNIGWYGSEGTHGAPETGWELVPVSGTSNYLIRESGTPSSSTDFKVLDVVGGAPGAGVHVALVQYDPSSQSQQWMVTNINTVAYPGFLPRA